MTFVFDENISPEVPEILRILEYDARHVVEEFGRGSDDRDFIPQVGAGGWILVTGDHKMKTVPPEAQLLVECHVTAIFVTKAINSYPGNRKIAFFIEHWPAAYSNVDGANPGTLFEMTANGNVRRIGTKH